MTPFSFKKFVALWNVQQNQGTPHLHFRIARWIEKTRKQQQKRLLLMAFRACGKSTMVGLYAAWRLYCNPNLRILVISADDLLASKMVRNIKRIIERNILTQHLRPKQADQWGSDRFTVQRSQELRDPSVLSRGITANMTGSRADLIICDDVEVPNTSDNLDKRRNLRERLAEADFILMPDGMILYAGTPHSYHSIYTKEPAADHEDDQAFLKDYARLEIPLLNQDGECLWPERYTPQDIERMKNSVGPNLFASQMLLRPVNSRHSRLDSSLLQIYTGNIAYIKELNRLEINNRPMCAASAWWDPSFASSTGDHSVLAITYQDTDNHYWLQHIEIISIQDEDPDDNASQQCRQVARCLKDHMIPAVALEINGIGRFLPGILRKELMRQNVPCSVIEISSRRPKDIRILEAFDVLLASQHLHVHQSVMATPFATEFSEWHPGGKGHDDCLDAVAGALSLHPVRLGTAPPLGRQAWTKGYSTQQARTDFKV